MEVARASCGPEVARAQNPPPQERPVRGGWAGPWLALLRLQPAQKGLAPLPTGPASACLLLMLLAPPPAAPSCPMLCTCYSAPPTVSCQANNFSSVPLFLPPGTQRLFLQNNLIRTLRPGTFGPNLLTLWLFSNNLSTIYPGTFRHLQALEELDLGDNRHLRSLDPDTFQGLERLQSLHLYRCQLSSLPGNIFRGLVSLQYLYLQENSLLHLQVSRPTQRAHAQGHTPPHTHTHPPRHLRTPLLLSYLAPLSLCAFLLCPQATLPASPHFSVPVLSVPLTFSRDFFWGGGGSSAYLPPSVRLSTPVWFPCFLSLSDP